MPELLPFQKSYEYMLRESDGMILEWSIEGRAVGEATAELTLIDDGAAAPTDAQKSDATGEAQTEADPSAEGQTEAGLPVVKTTADGTELIGYEEAVRIALEDSGIAEADAELAKIKFEYDGRFYDYELELRAGRAEYEYKIDAQTGEIVEVEND